VVLVILGAIFTFAIRAESSWVNIQVVGLILMVAGGAIIYVARHGRSRVKETTVIEDKHDPDRPVHTVHESLTEQDPAGNP
jgi:hypothetical protein